MAYMLDNEKEDITSFLNTTGSGGGGGGGETKLKIYGDFEVEPSPEAGIQFAVYGNSVHIGNNNATTNLIIEGGVDFDFKQINDDGVDYQLADNDYAVEIISDTYETITLPSALDTGGRTYVISRGSNNSELVLQAQPGENIDDKPIIQLKRKNVHIKVMSNNIDSWYVV